MCTDRPERRLNIACLMTGSAGKPLVTGRASAYTSGFGAFQPGLAIHRGTMPGVSMNSQPSLAAGRMIPCGGSGRKIRRLASAWPVALLGLILAGCEGPPALPARALMSRGEYEQAVAQLRQAIERNPADQQTQILLAEAETAAAEQRLARARELAAQNRPREARQEIATALSFVPTHPAAIREAVLLDKAIQQSNLLVEDARSWLVRRDWTQAIVQAETALKIDATLTEARDIIAAARRQSTDLPTTVARAGVRPVTPTVVPDTSSSNETPSRPPPTPPLQTSAPLPPQPPQPAGALQPVPREDEDPLIRTARAEMEAGRWHRAIEILDEGLGRNPGDARLARHRAELACRWAEKLLEDALSPPRPAAAERRWTVAIQARVLCPDRDRQTEEILTAAENDIRRQLAYRLGVVAWAGDEPRLELVEAVTENLREAIRRLAPPMVQVVAPRERIEPLDARDADEPDMTRPATRERLARLQDTCDLVLLASLVVRTQDLRRPGEPAVSRYVVDKKHVGNPAYAAAEEAFNDARRKLTAARNEALRHEERYDAEGRADLRSDRRFLTRAAGGYYGAEARQAAEEYSAALEKLRSIPQRIEQEVYREHRYPTQMIERRTTLRLRLRLIELPGGKTLYREESLVAEASSSDTTHPADPRHNVPEKQAVLRSEQELAREAAQRIIGQLSGPAREVLARRAMEQLETARRERGEEAIAGYVRFLVGGGHLAPVGQFQAAVEELWQSATVRSLREPCRRLTVQRLGPMESTSPPAAPPTLSPSPPAQAAPPAPSPSGLPTSPVTGGQAGTYTISVEDNRYPAEVMTVDGISVRVRDTDAGGPDADLLIRVGDQERKVNDLPVRGTVDIRGQSGTGYRLTIVQINHASETVRFMIEPRP